MDIKSIRSDKVYAKMIASPIEKRNDIYRYELMQPFEKKWACYHIPLKAPTENGYDVVMASSMLGFMAPTKVNDSQKESIARLSSDDFWKQCQGSIERSLKCFTDYGVNLPTKDYLFTVLLANPESLMLYNKN